jgi:putative membrane protein insertion efficiency factor
MRAPATILRGAIRIYQLTLAYALGGHCRFVPSCSQYASEAIAVHGAAGGLWLALKRVARCNPWVAGGYDPVPRSAHDSKAHGPTARGDCRHRV